MLSESPVLTKGVLPFQDSYLSVRIDNVCKEHHPLWSKLMHDMGNSLISIGTVILTVIIPHGNAARELHTCWQVSAQITADQW